MSGGGGRGGEVTLPPMPIVGSFERAAQSLQCDSAATEVPAILALDLDSETLERNVFVCDGPSASRLRLGRALVEAVAPAAGRRGCSA